MGDGRIDNPDMDKKKMADDCRELGIPSGYKSAVWMRHEEILQKMKILKQKHPNWIHQVPGGFWRFKHFSHSLVYHTKCMGLVIEPGAYKNASKTEWAPDEMANGCSLNFLDLINGESTNPQPTSATRKKARS